ncbi:MAG: hypothetical protein JRN20_06580 [Nitrososphaerota archaeon]|nr:hypothetical protein [Nitrososphaerota archaeon]
MNNPGPTQITDPLPALLIDVWSRLALLDNTLTLQEGGSDVAGLAGREVVCEESEVVTVCKLEEGIADEVEKALEVNHGPAPQTITKRVNRHIALIDDDLVKFILVTNW